MVSFIHMIVSILFLEGYHSIKCVDQIQLQLSSSEMTLLNNETIFKNLKSIDRTMCQVYVEFDFINQKLIIKFGQSMEFPRLRSVENTYINIVTSMASVNFEKKINQTSIKTKINLICYSNHKCDQQLIFEILDRLIKTNYKDLESHIRSLIFVQKIKTNKCTVGNDNNTEFCSGTACSWYHSLNTKQNEGKCEHVPLRVLPMIELNTEIRMFEKLKIRNGEIESNPIRAVFKHQSSIKFWCKLNNCNNHKIGKLVKEVVNKYYDLWTIYKVCKSNEE
ncbi:unnamed protein product [Adineta steineri]|uniref:Uncharacterized protein n=1 Tax=Adineta steineri TaxID=433720 RepID=A0A813Z8M1_9BILA|nr:unnamed protein product [Adineta steineri]CAF1418697.1 unnamed protein product [Adineta steineri]